MRIVTCKFSSHPHKMCCFCSLLVSIPPAILLSPEVLWLIKTSKKKREHQASLRAEYGDIFDSGFVFLVLDSQELAVYFGFLLKGAWAVCLVGKEVNTFGSAALAPGCGPWSRSLASRMERHEQATGGASRKEAGE